MSVGGGVALAVRTRDEWDLLQGLLESVQGFCEEAWILDDASSEEAPDKTCTALPRVVVIRAASWSIEAGAMGEGLQRDYLLQRIKRDSACEWVLQLDTDERLSDPALMQSLVAASDCDAWVLPLVDFYITTEDKDRPIDDAPNEVRNWFGIETRWTLCLYRLSKGLYVPRGDVREPQGFARSRVRRSNSPLVEHYGKAISFTEWERKADFYISSYPHYREKWIERKGKAIHDHVSDFGTPLVHRASGSFAAEQAPSIYSYAVSGGLRALARSYLYGRLAPSLHQVAVLPPPSQR